MKMRLRGVAGALCAAAAVLTVCAGSSRAQERIVEMSGITVQGTGEVQVKPDLARVVLGVQTQGPDSARAAQENAKMTQAVIDAVKNAGVAEKDIQTSNYSIYPQYDQRPRPVDNEAKPPTIVGYQVSNNVQVTVRKIGDVGRVIDAAVKAGANVAGGISFDLNEAESAKAKDEAMRRAVADAARKAQVIADAAKVPQISLASITEGGVNYPRPVYETFAARGGAMKADVATPVAPGEQTITATVTARYRMAGPAPAAPTPPPGE